MIAFLIVALLLAASSVTWMLRPLLRRSAASGLSAETSNLSILLDQVRELNADLANGALSAEQHAKARQELELRALEETSMRPTPPLADRAQSRMTALVIAVTLPASAAILYLALGNPRALLADAPGINATAEHAVSRESSERMAAALAERLANEPGDLGGWIMLARTYTLLNRLPDAAAAFGRASALAPDDADLLVDYGDALAASTGGKLDGKPLELVNEALKRNPRHWKALLLAGKAAFARGQYAEASEHWEKARVALPADSPLAPAIDASIARARSARTTTGAGDAR